MTVELVLLPRVAHRGQEITAPRLRALLALLAGNLRTGSAATRLAGELWPGPEQPVPEHPVKALQVLVSRARAQLGADVIVSTPHGYRLALDAEQLDTSAARLRLAEADQLARAGAHAEALARAEAGLALWAGSAPGSGAPGSGAPGSGAPGSGASGLGALDPLSALRAELAPVHRSLRRARALALAATGRPAEALEPLTALHSELPRDEEVLAQLLSCEAATLGPAAALARYSVYRKALRDELGADPGDLLQQVHQRLLEAGAPIVRHGVPHEPNQLLGRDADLAAVAGLLRTSRVTSIVGAGGLGKTRLAQAIGRAAEHRVVQLVPLAGVAPDGDVLGELASALGVGESGPAGMRRPGPVADVPVPDVPVPDVVAGILDVLGPGPALLVLDNCEHVLAAAANVVATLVARSRDLRVLTTSRAALGLSSEAVYPLPELSLPTSVELFTQRARAVRPGADLPADAVAALCTHLDGLPLAIELAAARVRVMAVPEIARRLDDRLALLRGGARDAPPRHQTLQAVIGWSWDLLPPPARAAMRVLSIFPAGFTAGAAGHLLDGDPLPVLEKLAEHSLLKVVDAGPDVRFRMLETVREFSATEREAAGETRAALDGFLAWARNFAVGHHEAVFGADYLAAVGRVRQEQDNLIHAQRLGLEHGDAGVVAATFAVLGGVWTFEANFARMRTLTTEAGWTLSHYRPEPAMVEVARAAAVLLVLGALLFGGARVGRSLVTLRRLPPARPETVFQAFDTVLRAPGPEAMLALCDSAEPLVAAVADGIATYLWEASDDPERALAAARRMLAALGDHEHALIRAVAHSRVGELALVTGRNDEGRHHLRRTLPALEALGAQASAVRVRWALVMADVRSGALDEAERGLAEVIERGDEGADLDLFDVVVRAEIQLARGQVEPGLRSLRQAAHRLRDLGDPDLPGQRAWAGQVQAAAVLAHAYEGRLEPVGEFVRDLPPTLRTLLDLAGAPGEIFVGLSTCGVVLLALAAVDLAGGDRRGAGMVALAERFGCDRAVQRTQSVGRARELARKVDGPAYAAAVSAYAGLDRPGLLAAARTALDARVS